MSEVGIGLLHRLATSLGLLRSLFLTITLLQEVAQVKIPITYAPLRTATAARARTHDVGKLRGTL